MMLTWGDFTARMPESSSESAALLDSRLRFGTLLLSALLPFA